jgi:hypothetical protein
MAKLTKIDVAEILQDKVNEGKLAQETVDWIAEFIEAQQQEIQQYKEQAAKIPVYCAYADKCDPERLKCPSICPKYKGR